MSKTNLSIHLGDGGERLLALRVTPRWRALVFHKNVLILDQHYSIELKQTDSSDNKSIARHKQDLLSQLQQPY